MPTKAELADAHERYLGACAAVAHAEAGRALHDALGAAEASLPLVHPSVTFQRRFLKIDHPVVPTVDCLLRCAPALFQRRALDAVERWYATGTRTEQKALPDLPDRLAAARQQLDEAVELWSVLAADPGARVRLEGGRPAAVTLVSVWLAIGAVIEVRVAGRVEYARASDPRRPARGKCAGCGHVLAVPLAKLLDPFPCPTCRRPADFVIVG